MLDDILIAIIGLPLLLIVGTSETVQEILKTIGGIMIAIMFLALIFN